MILGNLSPIIEISNAKTNGEQNSILIFGDESAKSWLPFLSTNYGKITFVQLNLASEELLSKISPEKYTHILFAYSISDFVLGIDFEKLDHLG